MLDEDGDGVVTTEERARHAKREKAKQLAADKKQHAQDVMHAKGAVGVALLSAEKVILNIACFLLTMACSVLKMACSVLKIAC